MTTVILHHYPQSPVAEKVRVVLGIKSLSWHSVEIPRLPPKPELMPLTGGYRRTPVMQIGADVYCDSQCIIRELERRFPQPTLFSADTGHLDWGLSRWTDGPLFTSAIAVVLGAAQQLPADFAADRGQLYFGDNFNLDELQVTLDANVAQLRGQLCWFDQQLSSGKDFLHGSTPALIDALAFYIVWFIRGRWQGGPEFLSQFKNLQQWEQNVMSIGHGSSENMTPANALAVALRSNPTSETTTDASDPQGLEPGMTVRIAPEGDGGDPEVTGTVVSFGSNHIAIGRTDKQTGDVVVHFPRVGYRVIQSAST